MGASPTYVPVIRTGVDVTFGDLAATGTLDVTGASALHGGLTVTGATSTSTLATTGNATVGGTLGVTGNTTLSAGLTVGGSASMNTIFATDLNGTSLVVTGPASVSGVITAGGRLVDADTVPADHGFETWSHDPYYPASSVIAVNGRIYAVKLPVRRAVTVDTLWWSVATAGATPVAGQNEVGLYSSAGVRLASANVDAAISSSGGKATAIAAQALTAGFVWQLFLFNATTAPTLVRGSSFESTPSINLPTTGLRAAVVASGATALPASFDPATLTTAGCLTFFGALEAA